jgi:hypothetical protein
LNLRKVRIPNGLFNPFHLYFSTIGSLYDIEKILSKFHLLFLGLVIESKLIFASSSLI